MSVLKIKDANGQWQVIPAIDPSPVVDAWLYDNIAQETGYVLDSSLAMSNAAAPADKVGELKSAIETLEAIPHSVKMAIDTLFSKAAYADDDAASSYATFHAWATANPVTSITAVFTQGSAVIYDSDSLDTLRQYLVVTATYADTTTATVSDYTLSGTLEVGTSTITVSYGGKTDTFAVTVSSEAGYVTSGIIHRWDGIDNTSSGHDSSTTTWEDLVGSVDLTKTGGTWNSNSLALSAANTQDIVYSDSLESITDATIEICFKYTGSTATAFAVFNPESGTGSRNARRFCLYTDNTIGGIASSGNTYTNTEQMIGDIRNISINYTGLTVNAMYVNGSAASISSDSHSFQYSGSKQMSLGGAGNSYKFYGEIYSIRIYNRALTATEVAQNYAYDLQRFELGSA